MSDPAEIVPGGEVTPPETAPEPSQAELLYDRLNNLDTRGETLASVLRPGQDLPPGMDWNQARALLFSQAAQPQEEEEFDPFAEVYGEQPAYEQPQYQEPVFDPRSLAPVFDQFGEHTRQQAVQEALQIFEQRQMEQAREQGITQGVSSAVETHKLSDFGKGIVEAMTRQAVQQQPNRAPGDIANEMAKAYLDDAAQRFVANGGVPPVQGAPTPGGPIPGDAAPKTFQEALEQSYSGLNPSM